MSATHRSTLAAIVLTLGAGLQAPAQNGVSAAGYDPDTQKQILAISTAAVREINQCIPGNTALASITFCNPGEECVARPGGLIYTLDTDADALLGPRIVKAQLWRLAAAHRPSRDSNDLPQWLVAGLYHRMLEQAIPAFSRNRIFPVTKLLLEADRTPQLRTLLDNPVSSDDPVVYELYAEPCALIIRMCQARQRNCLAELLRTGAKGTPADNLLAVLEGFDDEAAVQAWFEAESRRIAINIVQPISAAATRERLRELETVSLVKPGDSGGFGVELVPLEDVRYYLKTRKQDPARISDRLAKFNELRTDCPYLLRDAVDQYVSALRRLADGDEDKFEERIKAARAKFAEDYETAVAVSAFLSRQIAYQGGSLRQLEHRFRIHDGETSLLRDQAIDTFLDSLR